MYHWKCEDCGAEYVLERRESCPECLASRADQLKIGTLTDALAFKLAIGTYSRLRDELRKKDPDRDKLQIIGERDCAFCSLHQDRCSECPVRAFCSMSPQLWVFDFLGDRISGEFAIELYQNMVMALERRRDEVFDKTEPEPETLTLDKKTLDSLREGVEERLTEEIEDLLTERGIYLLEEGERRAVDTVSEAVRTGADSVTIYTGGG